MPVPRLSHSSHFLPIFNSVARVHLKRKPRRSLRLVATLTPSHTSNFSVAQQNSEPSSSSSTSFLRESKLHLLNDSLLHQSSPSRVWGYYTDLLNIMGYDKLPVEIHRTVLRHCTPPSTQLREIFNRRLTEPSSWVNPHSQEGRLRTVIRNIRATEQRPDLEDYHFVLDQFAAVGHHVGAMQVFKELDRLSLRPTAKTYGLCLQAITHRLSLPMPEDLQTRRLVQARQMLGVLIDDMRQRRVPFSSVNMDLALRIINVSLDTKGFEDVLKWGYGIDLSNPDRPPLDGVPSSTEDTNLGAQISADQPIQIHPFSTQALNITIDFLGRAGNISKLVQAFEVLTQPLPGANEHLFSSFDDDDDFGVAATPQMSTFVPAYAPPNTTSYHYLLKYLCQANHFTLARHYLNEVIHLDHLMDRILRATLRTNGLDATPAPRISVGRLLFLPVLGVSNRNKRIALLKWLSVKLHQVLKRKRLSLQHLTIVRGLERKRSSKLEGEQEAAKLERATLQPNEESEEKLQPEFRRSVVGPFRQALPPMLYHTPLPSPSKSYIYHSGKDSPLTPPSSQPTKLLDIDRHLGILQRDVEELEEFSRRVQFVLGRTHQRVKEHLSRRVWQGKDVYILDEDTRRFVSREDWVKDVNYKPKTAEDPYRSSIPVMRSKSLSTDFFQSNQSSPINQPLTHLASPSSPHEPLK